MRMIKQTDIRACLLAYPSWKRFDINSFLKRVITVSHCQILYRYVWPCSSSSSSSCLNLIYLFFIYIQIEHTTLFRFNLIICQLLYEHFRTIVHPCKIGEENAWLSYLILYWLSLSANTKNHNRNRVTWMNTSKRIKVKRIWKLQFVW